jgi:hypothetical protein
MRNAILIGVTLFLCSAFSRAQIPTSGNVFFGYSYFNTNASGLNRVNTNGWEATVEGKVFPFIGIVADFDAHYGSQNIPIAVVPVGTCPTSGCPPLNFNESFTEHNFLFGPRVGVSVGKFRPFAEAMFGAAHLNSPQAGSDTSLATAVGGGLDYRLIRLVAWRIQGDYVHTRLFNTKQDNARISTGIVVRF